MFHSFISSLLVLFSITILYIIFKLSSINNKISTLLLIVLLITIGSFAFSFGICGVFLGYYDKQLISSLSLAYGIPILYIYMKNKLKKLIYRIINNN
ncbi:hypothetical protein UT300018_03610 [Clostridium faecium]|uniref:hypothetical protein n=1 Tax=Clostridium butanoliproducens TaxID=2991837 RepID=UPI0024B9146F|nr:hypothetical protein [Clostridium butanoliproducens]